MKLDTTSLKRALTTAVSVADPKGTMPALAMVRLRASGRVAAEGQEILIEATDLNQSCSVSVIGICEPGEFLACNARDLLERIKALPNGDVTLKKDGNSVAIKAGTGSRRFRLSGLTADDLPTIAEVTDKTAGVSVNADALLTLIDKTIFAVSVDNTRVHLNSALLEFEAGKLRMVSTDGHRLSLATVEADVTARPSLLIPLKSLFEIKRACDTVADPTVNLVAEGSSLYLVTTTLTLGLKLTEAQFPPYQQVIPDKCETTITLGRAAFANALSAVSIAASNRTGMVKLTLAKGIAKLEASGPETGDGHDELATDYAGPDLSIGFNARYMIDAFSAAESDEVTLGLGGELDPMMVGPVTAGDGATFLAVVMPARV